MDKDQSIVQLDSNDFYKPVTIEQMLRTTLCLWRIEFELLISKSHIAQIALIISIFSGDNFAGDLENLSF